MSAATSVTGGRLSPAELKALTDGDGSFTVTTLQWQDAARSASASDTGRTETAPATSGEPSADNVKLAKELLREARETKDPELKAELLKSAIDLLNSKGGAGEDTVPGGASDTPATPTRLEGDALQPYLSAEGGNVEQGKDGGWAVGDAPGNGQKVDGEINRGQSLTANTPAENEDNQGGTVELGKLFKNGPDGEYVEKARVTFRDADGKIVDEQIVEGSRDGNVSVSTDENFATVEVAPEDNGAGGRHNNSDFTLRSVSYNGAEGTSEAEAVATSDDQDSKLGEVFDLLGTIAGLIPGIGPMAGPALDKLGELVDLIAGARRDAA